MTGKRWYHSKTLWVNGLALLASLAQAKYGLLIDPALQGVILTVVNVVLRLVTNESIEGMEK